MRERRDTRSMPTISPCSRRAPSAHASWSIKAHEPSKALVYLMRLTRGSMFLSVREPRDAIASLMQRFGHAFEGALKETARQSARIAELAASEEMITYRYERRILRPARNHW